jgi:hypothetical protein
MSVEAPEHVWTFQPQTSKNGNPLQFLAVINVFAAPMVQHVKEMVLEVITNTSANIYIKISSIYLSLQSPVAKRCFVSLFQPHLAGNTATCGPRLYTELPIPIRAKKKATSHKREYEL